ncbi:LysR family transcriptional regulator [Brevibacterium album]|uniref:LysR family transcriptional regulator n=1 Tax=Brevibacterium album TaxID=417948 RepID=UPI0006877A30|nr:LysR family transcriptional regulator [Brevibacterium album]
MTSSHAQAGAGPRIAPDDLLTLLAVARLGKYTAAAHSLGINHTTVSRRIASLEKAVGERVLAQAPEGWELTAHGRRLLPAAEAVETALASVAAPVPRTGQEGRRLAGTVRIAAPEAFVAAYAMPALSRLQRNHAGLQVEVLTATQRARRYRSGMDIEVVVGRPDTRHSTAHYLRTYSLGLYASPGYLQRHGRPETAEDLADRRLIFYPEHSLEVDSLLGAVEQLPETAGYFRSNSVAAQLQAARLGVGVGLLPAFAAEADDSLVRVLPEFDRELEYWASVRPEALRSPVVEHVLAALR